MNTIRKEFIQNFKELITNCEFIHTAWEGGSAATGYLDEYSDLDLGIICDDDKIEAAFELIENYLQENYGIKRKFRMPEPNWHGHSQCFYQLEKPSEFLYADILIEKLSAGNRFMENDRHGNAIVWFDKKDLFDSTPTPQETIDTKCKRLYKMTAESIWVLVIEVKKQILRGNLVDAAVTYNQLLNRMAPLFNLQFRQPKVDFGLRYAERDFPKETVDWLIDKLYVKDLNDLQNKFEQVESKIYELIEALKDKWSE
jgi:hypothetical protein